MSKYIFRDGKGKQEAIGSVSVNSLISESQVGNNLHKCGYKISTTHILIICSGLSLGYSRKTLLTSGLKLSHE